MYFVFLSNGGAPNVEGPGENFSTHPLDGTVDDRSKSRYTH